MSRLHALGVWFALLTCGHAHAAQAVRVANEGAIRDEWMLPPGARLAAPRVPASHADREVQACIAVGYLIHADGSTGDFTLLKGWNSMSGSDERDHALWSAFAQSGAEALSQWRFQPRAEVERPRPTYTVATMVFGSTDAPTSKSLLARCRIDDLAIHLSLLLSDPRASAAMDTALREALRDSLSSRFARP